MTVHARVAAARRRLRDAGIPDDEADLDARILAEHVLGWTTERFLTDSAASEPPGFAERYEVLAERRARREPTAYIVRHQEFWGLDFEVAPAVLIPRPETEIVVEAALALCSPEDALEIADVCTGSGCIAVAIAHERPRARITGTEISNAALDVARRNASRHGVADRLTLVRADLLGGIDGPFDLIVANPPYVPDVDRASLQPEVRDHEPALALFAGLDGLQVVRRLVPEASARLRRGGHLIFEFGFGQADAVAELISRTDGLTMVDLRRDLQGIARTAIVQKT